MRRCPTITTARALASVLLLLVARQVSAQPPVHPVAQHIVDVWQESSGLPQNYVSVILQGRDGYIWVGTRGGLARFDGVRFTTFDDRRPDQLKDSEVWALAEGDDGSLWIGTYGGGLSRLSGRTFTTYRVQDGLPSDLISALAKTPDGSIWIGTLSGLARWQQGRFTRFGAQEGLPGGSVRALHVDRRGTLWIGTDTGIGSYSDGRFVSLTRAHPAELTGQVGAIDSDSGGGLWLGLQPAGTWGGGLRYVKDGVVSRFTIESGLPSNQVMSIAAMENGTVWVGTREGLCRRAGGAFERYVSEIGDTSGQQMLQRASLEGVTALTTDHEGNLWFGTRLDGLGRLREGLFINVAGETAGKGLDVRTVLGDDKGVWFGTARDLRRVEGSRVTIYDLGSRDELSADALAFDSEGTLVIGTPRGLRRLRAGKVEAYPLESTRDLDVTVLFTDRQGTVWAGTRSAGLRRLAGGAVSSFTSKDGLLGSQVRGVGQDSRGGIWIATRDGGVTCLRDGKTTAYGERQGISGPAVQALYVDRDDTVWAATRRGLDRIKDDRVSVITAAQGLPTNYFYQVVEDDGGYLWLTYARGIARVSKSELNAVADGRAKSVKAALYAADSGLRSSTMTVAHQPTAWKGRDGRLWFATARGMEVVDPRLTVSNAVPPPVHIEDVLVGTQWRPLSNLAIEPSRDQITILYTALSFASPRRVLFKYRLDGFDEDWVEAGPRRFAYYANLPHGSYRFRVIACNNEGVWNEAGDTLSFRVLPRWHELGWVRALTAALVVCLIVGFHRLRVRTLRQRERVLAARVRERTRDLQELTSNLEARVLERTAEIETANEALSAERERLAVTLASIGDGVIATDVDLHVVLMNRVAEETTGWHAAEAVGRPLNEVLPTVERESGQARSETARAALLTGRPTLTGPSLLHTREGKEIVVAESVAPIRDGASRIVGAVFAFRDITDRERIEDQLRNSQRLEALGVLAGGIAHDFNNLLTGIFGFVDVARADASDPERVREMMQRAVAVLEKARGLTRQLLTFSKAGEPVRKPTAIGPLVRDAVAFVLSGSNVVAECQVADDLWPCEVDAQQIDQVVDNLVINARQAMAGGGSIRVTLANVERPADVALDRPGGPYVCISVQDHGPGIRRELWSKIFEPFFTTKAAGSGLGLATVYSIVRRHGGDIDVESEEGKGSTFRVFLPATPGLAAVPQPSPHTDPAAPAPGATARVLVMDDEEYVREVARHMLTRLGYGVLLAGDDSEAVSLLEQAQQRGERVDIAILDMTIPGGLGGAAALERLRRVAPGLVAIASSGYSGDAVMARPAEHGFNGALPKPYTIQNMRTVVAEVLGASTVS